MKNIKFIKTSIKGLWIIEHNGFNDLRGSFNRLFCSEEFKEIRLDKPIVQINHCITKLKGTTRGMHYQLPPNAEIKIVTCLKGTIFDVAVDLRKNSETFLSWHGEELSDNNKKSFFIPEGFAHGYQALSNNCEILYFVTEPYSPRDERGINALDKKISISWPFDITCLSEKDSNYKFINDEFKGIKINTRKA